MIRSFKVDGYRGFRKFAADGLARVNLIVGKNNAGKTALLEALHFVASGADPVSLHQAASRRGEMVLTPEGIGDLYQRRPSRLADVSHLFHGHLLALDASCSFSADGLLECSIAVEEDRGVEEQIYSDPSDSPTRPWVLAIHRQGFPGLLPSTTMATLSEEGGLLLRSQRGLPSVAQRAVRPRRQSPTGLAQFVSTETLSARELAALWDTILLEGSKAGVIEALKIIEPATVNVEFLTGESVERQIGSLAGILVELNNPATRVPLGSLGEGMRRLLALSIALANTKGGTLLIDEIDTGLHYSVLAQMWQLVAEAARQFDIQVFATTHSADCVRGLELLCKQKPENREHIAIVKVVQGQENAVIFSGDEAAQALDLGIEVR